MSEAIEAPEVASESVIRERREASLIPINEKSLEIIPKDHTQLVRFIDQMISAKAIPKHLENREQVLAAWNYAAQLNLPPQPSLRNVAVIEGTPQLFGDLPLSLAQRHKDYMWHEEFTIDKDYQKIAFENKNLNAEIFAAVVIFMRKGMKQPESFSFTWDDATRAGINRLKTRNNNDTIWAKYPQIMLVRRARAMGLRAKFADALCGAAIAEELNYAPDLMKDVTPNVDRAQDLNSRFTPTGESTNEHFIRPSGPTNSERGGAQVS